MQGALWPREAGDLCGGSSGGLQPGLAQGKGSSAIVWGLCCEGVGRCGAWLCGYGHGAFHPCPPFQLGAIPAPVHTAFEAECWGGRPVSRGDPRPDRGAGRRWVWQGRGRTYAGSPGDPTRRGWRGEQPALTLAVPHGLTLPGSEAAFGVTGARPAEAPGRSHCRSQAFSPPLRPPLGASR